MARIIDFAGPKKILPRRRRHSIMRWSGVTYKRPLLLHTRARQTISGINRGVWPTVVTVIDNCRNLWFAERVSVYDNGKYPRFPL